MVRLGFIINCFLLLRKTNIRYSLCLLAFKINKKQRDFSEIRLLVIQNAFKWLAKESNHHGVGVEEQFQHYLVFYVPTTVCRLWFIMHFYYILNSQA